MAKKKDTKNHTPKKQSSEDYYKLKTDAVDRLVNADKKSYPKTKEDPGRKYRSKGFLDKIPSWVKSLFIKFWFNGAVCFFIFWGLGLYVTNMLDMIVVLAIVMGMVTDIFVNNAFRFLATYEGQNDKWMMFPKKKYWTFFANIFYALIILIGVIWFYNILNVVLNNIKGTEAELYIAVEPLLFGLSYMAIDMIFITMKNTMIKIVSDAKEKSK
ncbi:MAG: hypothetical protein J6J42_03750 [Lachnospiraceae bacterium]|nr:hypothetical protein [Lachnospiraceae bacterium]